MPRSYRFDHFTANDPEKEAGRALPRPLTLIPQSDARPAADKIHYGKKFAQTQEWATVHQMEKQLEELAGLEPEQEMARAPKAPAQARMQETRKRTAPIGAVPSDVPPEPTRWRDVFDEAVHQLSRARSAVIDLGQVGWRLITLPMRMAKMAASRFVPRES